MALDAEFSPVGQRRADAGLGWLTAATAAAAAARGVELSGLVKTMVVRRADDDFVLFPDDGKRHELIDGEHFVTPSPNTKHQRVSVTLTVLIGGWLDARFVLIPAGMLVGLDRTARTLEVALTQQQVAGSPDISIDQPVSPQLAGNRVPGGSMPAYWSMAGLWGLGGL
ncbi:Uma2 family endonuclease [Lacticaseibacillus rhamnosus]